MPNTMRYQANGRKVFLDTYAMSVRITTSAEMNATTKPMAKMGMSLVVATSAMSPILMTDAPSMAGMARKNENSVAAVRESPSVRPPRMVAPERDIPVHTMA